MDVSVQIPDHVLADAINEKLKTFKPVDPFPEVMDKITTAKFLHCSRVTLDEWIKTENLPVCKIGNNYRFVKTDLVSWLKSHSN